MSSKVSRRCHRKIRTIILLVAIDRDAIGEDFVVAHLWIQNGGEWHVVPLECGVWSFDGATLRPSSEPGPAARGAAAVIASFKLRGQTRHLVCAPALGDHVSVNGTRPAGGARVLRDRDEVLLGESVRAYYSTERRPVIATFPGFEDRKAICPRCKDPIEPGTPAVECPGAGCGLWYHQTDERPCWTYDEVCFPCGHATPFEADFQWTPAAL
jgi:hypothetical protein